MGYSDQKFYARPYVAVANASLGTSTASSGSVQTYVNAVTMPVFKRATKVNKIDFTVGIASNAASVLATLKNGTATMGTATIGAGTAGQTISLVPTGATGTFTAASGPTLVLTGTETASGKSAGSFIVEFEQQELFS